MYLYVHAEGRDSFVREGITEEFVRSALMTKLFNIAYRNEENGKAFARLFARRFVQTTYYLEDDGCVVLYTYGCLMYCSLLYWLPTKPCLMHALKL